jgi:hypothetical protein
MADIILNMYLTNFWVCLLQGWFDIIQIVLQNTQVTSRNNDLNVVVKSLSRCMIAIILTLESMEDSLARVFTSNGSQSK